MSLQTTRHWKIQRHEMKWTKRKNGRTFLSCELIQWTERVESSVGLRPLLQKKIRTKQRRRRGINWYTSISMLWNILGKFSLERRKTKPCLKIAFILPIFACNENFALRKISTKIIILLDRNCPTYNSDGKRIFHPSRRAFSHCSAVVYSNPSNPPELHVVLCYLCRAVLCVCEYVCVCVSNPCVPQ